MNALIPRLYVSLKSFGIFCVIEFETIGAPHAKHVTYIIISLPFFIVAKTVHRCIERNVYA